MSEATAGNSETPQEPVSEDDWWTGYELPEGYYDDKVAWGWGDPLPQSVVDVAAGFGDGASFGATYYIRDWMGTNGVVNSDSIAYQLSTAGGVLTSGGAYPGGTKTFRFLNRNRYLRLGPGRMPANGGMPAGPKVPRMSIGKGPGNPHFDLRVRPFDK